MIIAITLLSDFQAKEPIEMCKTETGHFSIFRYTDQTDF